MRGVGKNTVSQLLSGIVAMEGYLQLKCRFPVNNLFPFLLATAQSIGDVWLIRQSGVKLFSSQL
jgi:hypothetical protein